jgi:hypothetical protein
MFVLAMVLLGLGNSYSPLITSFLLLLVPAGTLALGLWTGRTNRVGQLLSTMAIAAGGLGISLTLVPAAIALISTWRR